jgi:transposase
VYVGLDYHQSSVQACVMDAGGRVLANRKCKNDAGQIIRLARSFGDRVFGAIEACTGAANLAEELITRAGWSVDLAHPGYVARLKQSPDKHDWGDARLLADLERVGYLPKVWLAPEDVRELRRLVRYRQQVVAQRRNIRLRISAMLREQRLRPPARPWTRLWLAWLHDEPGLTEQGRWIVLRQLAQMKFVLNEIRIIERRLEELTANDPVVARLQSMQGIGPVTAWTIRAEIGRFDRFRSGKQLARFCGLSPRNASSGERQADSGLIKAGNRQLRAILIEAAHRLARYDGVWSTMAAMMICRGKPKCVVIAAVANRWVRWLYHEMQSPDQAA